MATPTWTAPTTWAAGNVPTAAQFNAQLRDNPLHLVTPVACQATRVSTNLSISTATFTAVTLPTENWDTDTIHSTAVNTSRFTIPTGMTGIYHVDAQAAFAAQAGGVFRALFLYKNGSVMSGNPAGMLANGNPTAGVVVTAGSRDVSLTAGDYLEIYAYQDSGSSVNITDASVNIRKVSN